ncbi:MAG: ATP-binding protein, partial [Candidatus Ancillula sp.]|nr:ATP-binding protein [Candidatus Ancillula sp.]
KRPVVLIDEYDKLYMDTAKKGGPDYDNAREFTKGIMAPALKDNPSLEKAVITGVNRIAQESMFSELNNIEVDGVFNPSIFDEDFGFTDDEVKALIPPEEFDWVQRWYDNYRVGDKEVFFTYSVVSYLKRGTFDNYWGKSGTIDLIDHALTNDRIEQITKTIGNGGFEAAVQDRISGEDLMNHFPEDKSFYSLLVQTGYMTHTPIPNDDDNDNDDDDDDRYYGRRNVNKLSTPKYILNCPNIELELVWRDFILSRVAHMEEFQITDVFKLTDDLALFEFRLNDLINYKLSYYDFEKKEPEKTYHIFMLAMLVAVGFKVTSNKELGRGRYDLLMTRKTKSRGTEYFIFEFKRVDTPGKDAEFLQVAASEAIAQIREKDYAGGIEGRVEAPVYLIGIGFCGSQNWVKAEEL